MDDKEKKKQSIIQAGLVICIMALYIVWGIHFLPPLTLLIPVPFIVLGVRNGFSWNILSIVITLLVVEIFLGDTMGASLVIVFAPLSMAINYCIEKRKNTKQTIFISTIVFLVPLITTLILGMKIADIDLITEMNTAFTEYISVQTGVLKEVGLESDKILDVVNNVESLYSEFLMIIPSLIIVFSIFITYINYFFTGVILRKMKYGLIRRPSLSRFQLPRNIILGTGIMLATSYLFKQFNFQNSEALLLNILFLILTMFMIQGLAVLDFVLKRMKINLVFRVILIVIFALILPMGSVIIFIGLLDSVFDMRKLRRLKS